MTAYFIVCDETRGIGCMSFDKKGNRMKVYQDIKTFDQLIDVEHGVVRTAGKAKYHVKNLCMSKLSCKEN